MYIIEMMNYTRMRCVYITPINQENGKDLTQSKGYPNETESKILNNKITN